MVYATGGRRLFESTFCFARPTVTLLVMVAPSHAVPLRKAAQQSTECWVPTLPDLEPGSIQMPKASGPPSLA